MAAQAGGQLTRFDIRKNASKFAERWKGKKHGKAGLLADFGDAKRGPKLKDEKAEAQTFYNELFEVFGIQRLGTAFFEHYVKKIGRGRGFIDLYWPKTLIAEHKSMGEDLDKAMEQANEYLPGLQNERYKHPPAASLPGKGELLQLAGMACHSTFPASVFRAPSPPVDFPGQKRAPDPPRKRPRQLRLAGRLVQPRQPAPDALVLGAGHARAAASHPGPPRPPSHSLASEGLEARMSRFAAYAVPMAAAAPRGTEFIRISTASSVSTP